MAHLKELHHAEITTTYNQIKSIRGTAKVLGIAIRTARR